MLGVCWALKGWLVMVRARSVLRLVLSAGLAVLVLGALGVSSASAATAPALKVCKKVPSGEKGLWNSSNCGGTSVASGEYAWSWADNGGAATIYCLLGGTKFTEALCEGAGTGPFGEVLKAETFPRLLGLLLLSTLIGHAATIATELDCKDGDFSGTGATATLTINTTITYLACTVVKPANCEVGNVGGAAGTIKTQELNGLLESLTLVNFTPAAASLFVEVEYKGSSCSLKADKFPIKGSQMCEFGTAAQTPAVEQLLNCKKTASSLTLGTEPATYEGLTHIHFEGLPYWKVR
jgi:hypothetical protein